MGNLFLLPSKIYIFSETFQSLKHHPGNQCFCENTFEFCEKGGVIPWGTSSKSQQLILIPLFFTPSQCLPMRLRFYLSWNYSVAKFGIEIHWILNWMLRRGTIVFVHATCQHLTRITGIPLKDCRNMHRDYKSYINIDPAIASSPSIMGNAYNSWLISGCILLYDGVIRVSKYIDYQTSGLN